MNNTEMPEEERQEAVQRHDGKRHGQKKKRQKKQWRVVDGADLATELSESLIPELVLQINQHTKRSSVIVEGEDGVDHILLSNQGSTNLGRKLALNYKVPGDFVFPNRGNFSSLGAFWAFIRSGGDDSTRYLHGNNAKSAAKGPVTYARVPNFKAMLCLAMYHRILQDKALLAEVLASTLKFEFYSIYMETGARRFSPIGQWYPQITEEVRRALKIDCANPGTPTCLDLRPFMDT